MKFLRFNSRFWFGFFIAAFFLGSFALPFLITEAQTTRTDSRPREAVKATPTPLPPAPVLRQSAPVATPTPTPGGEPVEEDEGPIVIKSDLVNLNVRVVDRNGRVVGDVRPEEFKVFEDNVPQKIEFVSREEVPVNYGLMIDNSGSLRSQLEKVIEAGKILVTPINPKTKLF